VSQSGLTKGTRRGLILLMVMGVACGGVGPRQAAQGSPCVSSEEVSYPVTPTTWHQPLPVTIASTAEARLAFAPRVSGLGPPTEIVWRGTEVPAAFRGIAWVYDDPTYGCFYVGERIVSERSTRGAWADQASQSPGCRTLTPEGSVPAPGEETIDCVSGDSSFVMIRDGTVEAYLEETDIATALSWLEPVPEMRAAAVARYPSNFPKPILEFVVIGPPEELTRSEAIEIAGKV
jgi:hypothetical protein